MSDKIHFGGFSRAVSGFTSSTDQEDLDKFLSENPDLQKESCEFSMYARLQLAMFTVQKYNRNVVEDFITPGQEFRVVSLEGLKDTFEKIFSFIAVSSASGPNAPSREDLDDAQTEISEIYKAAEFAKKKWGKEACFVIW